MEVSIREDVLPKAARIVVGIFALVQGIGLYWLYNALDNKIWPYDDWTATMMIAMFLIVVPTSVIMTYRDNYPVKRYWSWAAAMACVFLWIAWYSASSMGDDNRIFRENFYLLPMCLLLGFVSLFFFKSWMRDQTWPPSYESQFGFSWHNFLSFTLAWLFTLIFWLILSLWGALFNIVNITFFKDLFREEWFLYPVLSLGFAYAVVMFRTKINAVGAVQRILRALISILLPLLLSIAAMFVTVLPFTGVGLIWEKGYGSGTILGFVGLTLFFFNAVYQDGKHAPYSDRTNSCVKFSVPVLNALVALAAYGLWQRVAQYGLTVERVLAIILLVLVFGYVASYSFIILFKRSSWGEYFGKANTTMALVMSLVVILVFTPLLDMERLSVNSQMSRLDAGKVSIDNFDFHYLARSGHYGLAKLESLKAYPEVEADESLSKRLQEAIDKKGRGYYRNQKLMSNEQLAELIEVYPMGSSIDPSFWEMFRQRPYNFKGCKTNDCVALLVDLNSDGIDEYILFEDTGHGYLYSYTHHKNREGAFRRFHSNSGVRVSMQVLREQLAQKNFQLLEPKWKDLKIGDHTFNTSAAAN